MQSQINVVVPTMNRLEQVQQSLTSILVAAEEDGATGVTIVDNGSTDGTWEWLSSLAGPVRCLLRKGVTISQLRNVGVEASDAPILSFIDSDCVVDPGYFRRVREQLARSQAGVVGCMYGTPEDVHWIEKTWMALNCPVREGDTNALPGGSMAMHRAVFLKAGGFDPEMITGEDAELCERIRRSGERIFETPALRLVHLRNMRSLSGFFRKQVWHSLGMIGGRQATGIDRMTMMTVVHIALTLGAIAVIVAPGLSTPVRLLAISGPLAVPVLAVIYRVARRGGTAAWLPSTILYTVYFFARAWGLLAILLRRLTRH